MTTHRLYTSKYQAQTMQFSNSASMIVALCEKALGCISNAQSAKDQADNVSWCRNLNIVQEIINIILAALRNDNEDRSIKDIRKFYMQLSSYTNALAADKIDSTKSTDLLEAFRITRDTWKSVEQEYIELKSPDYHFASDSLL